MRKECGQRVAGQAGGELKDRRKWEGVRKIERNGGSALPAFLLAAAGDRTRVIGLGSQDPTARLQPLEKRRGTQVPLHFPRSFLIPLLRGINQKRYVREYRTESFLWLSLLLQFIVNPGDCVAADEAAAEMRDIKHWRRKARESFMGLPPYNYERLGL